MSMLGRMVQFVLLISAGCLFGIFSKQRDRMREMLTSLILDLVLPCNILISFVGASLDDESALAMLEVTAGSVAYMLLAFVLNTFLYRCFAKDEQPSLKYATMIPNCAFLGTPLCESMYDATGLMLSSIYQIPERIVVWVFAPLYYDRKSAQSARSALRMLCSNPCVLAVFLGLAMMVARIQLPEILLSPIEKLGNCSTPLSMVMIGMAFAGIRLKDMLNWKVLYFCLLRLLVIPALVLLACFPFRGILPSAVLGVIVIMAALPGGTVAVLLAERHGMAARFASQCMILSTLLSCVTLPLWSAVLEWAFI